MDQREAGIYTYVCDMHKLYAFEYCFDNLILQPSLLYNEEKHITLGKDIYLLS